MERTLSIIIENNSVYSGSSTTELPAFLSNPNVNEIVINIFGG